MEKLLTPEEAASRLIVSPKTVRDWLREGTLNGVKVGKLWRIREADLKNFIARSANDNAALAKESQPAYSKHFSEDEIWLAAELGSPLPSYDWGPEGPPKTRPVVYVPGKGFVVKGVEKNGR